MLRRETTEIGAAVIAIAMIKQKKGAAEKSAAFVLKRGENVHTYEMEKLRKIYLYVKEKYEFLTMKKYTTLAGTLVFFLIMSIVPLSFWLTLLVGKLPVNTEQILQLPIFDSVKNVLLYVQKEAANATGGASLLLLITTLYSATNLFYQMRRSGEIIYDYYRKKQGIRLRLGALALMFVLMLTVVAFLLLFAVGTFLFSRYVSGVLERIADYSLLAVLAFALVWLLNAYICPYKTPMKQFLPGTALTVGAWAIAVAGFTLYLKISNMDKLYGALSTIIVFLLWLYILMICFIVGVIFNSDRIKTERKAKNLARKKQRLAHEK